MAFSHAWCIKPSSSKSNSSTAASSPPKNPGRRRRPHSRSITPPSSGEPTSPRVGCMGQIRWRKLPPPPLPGHAFSFFPSTASASFSSSGSTPETGSSRAKSTKETAAASRGRPYGGGVRAVLSVEEMDPPLPVERLKERPEMESLWKRRCRGADQLRELQLRRPLRLPEIQVAVNSGLVAV